MELKEEKITPLEELKQYMGLPAEGDLDLEMEQAPAAGKQRRSHEGEQRPQKHRRPGGKGQGQGQSQGSSPQSSQRAPRTAPRRGAARPGKDSAGSSGTDMSQLKELIQAVTRLSLRHEDALNVFGQDTRMIFFCGTGDRGMPEPLFRVAQLWKEKKEQGRATLSLRVTLAMSIFSATLDRCREIHQKAEKIEQAKEQGMMKAEGAWPYLLWDAGNQRHVLNPRREPLTRGAVEGILVKILELLPESGVINRFHSLRPLQERPEAPVIALIMDIGLRSPAANEVYRLLEFRSVRTPSPSCRASISCRIVCSVRAWHSMSRPGWQLSPAAQAN